MFLQDLFFFLQLNFLDIFAKKRQRNRHGWSDGTRRRDLEDLQNSTQRISASRGISGDGLSERFVQLVRGYIWMPFRGMNRFIIEDIEYTA